MINAIRIPGLPQLDLKLGFALMRDRRIPLRSKISALVLGLGITGLVEFLELPVEGILSALLPVLGIMGDVALDGAELIAGPLLLAHLLLPIVAPRHLVDQIRSERAATATAGDVRPWLTRPSIDPRAKAASSPGDCSSSPASSRW
jgi:hypothetical protein